MDERSLGAGVVETELVPAHTYTRRMPVLFDCRSEDDGLLAYFYATIGQRTAACPAEGMTRFERAYVYDGQYVLDTELAWFGPSVVDLTVTEALAPVLRQAVRDSGAVALGASEWPTVVIGKAGSDNFGHSLVEIMPKLMNIGLSGFKRVRLLLPVGMSAFGPLVLLVLDRLGVVADLVWVPKGCLQVVQELVYFGPVSQHNTRKSATFKAFRDVLLACLNVVPRPQRKFYITRKPTEDRSLENGDDVAAAFHRRGYEVVHPGGMSITRQIAVFSQASHIAGPLGAGLSNLAFAPAECLFTIIDPGLGDFFFWDLAAVVGQRTRWVFAGPLRPYAHDFASARYSMDLGRLGCALDLGE